MYAVSVTVDGVPEMIYGVWATSEAAAAWMDEKDEYLADLEVDLVKENARYDADGCNVVEVETQVIVINDKMEVF